MKRDYTYEDIYDLTMAEIAGEMPEDDEGWYWEAIAHDEKARNLMVCLTKSITPNDAKTYWRQTWVDRILQKLLSKGEQ